MATFNQREFQQLFIGAAATKTTDGISAMNPGEIGIFTPSGARVTEANAGATEKFIIVRKRTAGVPLAISAIIDKSTIKSGVRKVYVPAVNQVTTIGYNGTSGSITDVADTDYFVRVNLRQGRTSNHGGLYLKHAFYKTGSTTSELDIASVFVKSLTNEFLKEADKVVKVDLLTNDAGVATTGAVSYVKGSKYATAVVPADFEIGGLLRLGTATTSPVYKIVNITSTTLELDTFVMENTATLATGAAESVSAANALAASYGIRLTAQPGKYVVGRLENDLSPELFDVTVSGFGATPITRVAGTAGTGTLNQVKSLEWFVQGNDGNFIRKGEPYVFPSYEEASGNYDLIDLVTEEISTDSMIAGPIHKVFTIAIPQTAPNYAVAGTADDITDVLEILVFGSATGAFAVS
jgi:hypothetical protein